MIKHAAAMAAALSICAGGALAAPMVLHVTVPASAHGPISGRLLVFAKPLDGAKIEDIHEVDIPFSNPRATAIAATEVRGAAPGSTIDIDADVEAWPTAFSKLASGSYAVQAVLDVNHSYAYGGREAGDLVSPVTELYLPAGGELVLGEPLAEPPDPWTPAASADAATRDATAAARADTHAIDFVSPALSRFWGRPVHMRGWVVTPPGYAAHPAERYPTVYYTPGFGGALRYLAGTAVYVHRAMADGSAPPMIWVLLDESGPTGTHEFADSVNNGPWGQALTTELIPWLEKDWRMDARPSGRFLNGHSSGGWATLWLQTRYPALFGGTWSTSPDPSDFHDFTGVDLYAPGANMYRRADGSAVPIVRDHGKVVAEMEDFARVEAVEGPYGGQMSSFDWVFSPRGPGGRPEPMFDRVSGDVDPAVVAYWRDNYDIAYRLARDWPQLKPDLDGKIHLIVGTADTFYLDGAAHRLQGVLDGLGAKSDFRFLPDRTHMDLYVVGDDRRGLLKAIAWEMYAVARPGSKPPAPQPESAAPR
jgi:S-formylglutathione hydrolase FrmB